MRSVVPSESATVPLPDHDPLKPVNGPDWAWFTDTDNMSAAPTPAALIACPNNLEPNSFISNFPIQMTFLYKAGIPQITRELAWIFVVFLDPCKAEELSLIHISEPTRLGMISYAVFCLKKKKKTKQ